jgi:eukaryotic-like serine/threonine-protein kinase
MSTKSTIPDHAEGWSVPGYVEKRELSHGASGRVVEAVQDRTSRRVAIKYLGSDVVRSPDFLPRFRNQVLRLAELDVPAVVRVYDYAAQPGKSAAVIMEMVDGVSLRSVIDRQGPLQPEAALAVLKGTLLGLAAVHRLGFGHRDVKPGNVLVDTAGQAKLTDFGVVAPAAGTPAYQAPERWVGDPGSPASEAYAATAVFVECLTGAPPFSGDLARLQEQHADGALPLDRVDAPLAPLIVRGMARDPANRPQTANAFATELETLAVSAYGPDWEERGRHLLAVRVAVLRPLSPGGGQDPPVAPPVAASVGGGGRHRRRLVVIGSVAAAAVIALGAIAAAVTLSGGGHKATLSGSVSAAKPAPPSYSAVANVTPPVAASKCAAPTAFTYSATISATAPGTEKYQWVYSSGGLGPVRVVSFTEAGNRVVTGKTVKVKRAGGGWAELELLSPVPKTSAKATYKLLCGARKGGGITATAAVQPATRTASCKPAPPPFTADGTITAAKAETVSYYWAQSDGEDSALTTLTFAKAGTLAAEPLTIIPQPASGSGEVVLVVTKPVVAASAPATYTLSCAIPKAPPTSPITSTALSARASVSPASQSLRSCSALTPTFTFSGMITDSKAGTVSYHWRLPGGGAPAGTLHFSHAGTQTVTTAYRPGSDTARGSGTLVITSPVAVSSNAAAFALSCGQGLGITNDAPTIAQVGQAYSGAVTVSGGTGPYTWSVTGLPGGLTASGGGATLTISGDPQAAGTFTPRVSVHDSASPELRGTTSFTLVVDSVAESPLVISGYLGGAVVGQAYSATAIVTGGDGTYNWAVDGLPAGLTAIPSGGTLTVSGTPTDSGSFPVTMTVSDTESPAQTAEAGLTLVVASPITSPPTSGPSSTGPTTGPPTGPTIGPSTGPSDSPTPSPSLTPSPSPSPSTSPSSSPSPSPSLTPSTDDGGSGDSVTAPSDPGST